MFPSLDLLLLEKKNICIWDPEFLFLTLSICGPHEESYLIKKVYILLLSSQAAPWIQLSRFMQWKKMNNKDTKLLKTKEDIGKIYIPYSLYSEEDYWQHLPEDKQKNSKCLADLTYFALLKHLKSLLKDQS